MKRTELPEYLQKVLYKVCFANIATVCPDGRPWNTPMVVHFDDELTMYWITNNLAQHLRNLEREPQVFATVYDSSLPNGSPEIDALYMQMQAEILSTPEAIAIARKAGVDFTDHLSDHKDFLNDCPRRLVKATPLKLWHNVEIEDDNHTIDARQAL